MIPIKVSNSKFIIKKTGKMNTNAILFVNDKLMKDVNKDVIEQITNVASLPEIVGDVLAMPDMHYGFGFPIGGVAAFDYEKGIVTPAGVGFDINCGMRLLFTNVKKDKLDKKILKELFDNVPVGVGCRSQLQFDADELIDIVTNGIDWAISKGYATKDDKEHIEDYGVLPTTAKYISESAIKRGRKQVGTLGAGNHFLEIQVIDKVFNKELADAWGLKEGNICVMLHSGSRGFGHQIASDYIDKFKKLDCNKDIIDKQLIFAPINSEEGKEYIDSMNAAANYAYVNRQMMTYNVRKVFDKYNIDLKLLYDVNHNIAKRETYTVNGKECDVLVHRKGATRAFSKGNELLPKKYIATGQPVIIPGSMGSFSFVLVGHKAEEKSFGTVSHGAGRVMSRAQAMKTFTLDDVEKSLKEHGVELLSKTRGGAIEEVPKVYKDVSEVVNTLEENGLAKPVVRLRPLMVIKG